VQGYVSGANFLLLNEYNNYVDMNGVEPGKILKLVFDFCKANPNDKPISAIDKFIRDAKKVEVSEKDAFNPWEQSRVSAGGETARPMPQTAKLLTCVTESCRKFA
jgi:hypothetical protein